VDRRTAAHRGWSTPTTCDLLMYGCPSLASRNAEAGTSTILFDPSSPSLTVAGVKWYFANACYYMRRQQGWRPRAVPGGRTLATPMASCARPSTRRHLTTEVALLLSCQHLVRSILRTGGIRILKGPFVAVNGNTSALYTNFGTNAEDSHPKGGVAGPSGGGAPSMNGSAAAARGESCQLRA